MHRLFFDYIDDNFLMLTTKKLDIPYNKLINKISKKVKLNTSNLVRIKQIHSNNVLHATKSGFHNNYDGIITNIKYDITPIIVTADCVPLFIYDKIAGNYGIIHCGWRGIVLNIHLKAIEKFILLSSKINDIKIYSGPSIKNCCYEIGEDIIEKFTSEAVKLYDCKYYLSLIDQINYDFIKLGINNKKITHSNICTFHDKNCCSYRRDNNNSGRMYSMILKK